MSTIKRCAACGKQSPVSTMKTCMHAEMHNYVCDSKCMSDFYNPPKKPAPSLPAAGSAGEAKALRAYDQPVRVAIKMLERTLSPTAMEIAAELRSCLGDAQGALSAQQSARQPELTVWEGPMPESNGKSNFTAVLMRKGADLFDGIAGGMTIARSEYPDRVRYKADSVRWLIGELDQEPCITDYDADKHSGYVAQQSAPERVSVDRALIERFAHGRSSFEDIRLLQEFLASHGRGEA